MLKNIPKILSPELIKILCEMGHGDEIVIGDANFPSHSVGSRVVRADGVGGVEILDAILTVFPVDKAAPENAILMRVNAGEDCKTPIWDDYKAILKKHENGNEKIAEIAKPSFYERARKAYAVIATGEPALYANLILKKGTL